MSEESISKRDGRNIFLDSGAVRGAHSRAAGGGRLLLSDLQLIAASGFVEFDSAVAQREISTTQNQQSRP